MKKKIIIPIIVLLILVVGAFCFVLWNNRIVSTITLDINPSIEINLDKNEKVVNVKALNDDAKDIVSNKYNSKTLEEAFELLTVSLVDKGYGDNDVDVILYIEGKVQDEDVVRKVEFVFGKQDIHAEVIAIQDITKEDRELAKKYNISPAKASYIKSIVEDNKSISVENLADRSVSELKETKETGKYCDEGYILEGDWCLKEKERVSALSGEVCPRGYYEYNGKCYEETPSKETSKLLCRDEFKLEGEKCIRRTSVAAAVTGYTCSNGVVKTKGEVGQTVKGSGDANDPVCVDPSSVTRPVSPCQLPASDPTERMSYGGKCYWHRAPVIASGCPGKIQVNGACWDDATNVYLCPNGKNHITRTKDDYCYVVLKNVKPTPNGYKCDNGMTLTGDKCTKEEIEDATNERVCPNGYTLVNYDRCINYNNVATKEKGLFCDDEKARLKGNMCITYEMVVAKHN